MTIPADFKTKEPVVHYGRRTADGIVYDEVGLMNKIARDWIINRGMVWLTKFYVDGKTMKGSVIAPNRAAAESICFGRGLDEKVLGRCIKTSAFTDD